MNKPAEKIAEGEKETGRGSREPFEDDHGEADGMCESCLGELLTFGQGASNEEGADEIADESAPNSLWGDIFEKQRRGAVRIFNMLAEHGVALLADEVGTGKTYQALGVIAAVFARKPSARVVVIAPNESVQNGWRDKYKNFVAAKLKGETLRDPLTGRPTHPIYYCSQIRDFASKYRDNPSGLFLTRVSSFSNLRGSLDADETGKLDSLDPKDDHDITPKLIRDHWEKKGIYVPDGVLEKGCCLEKHRVRSIDEHLELCGESLEVRDESLETGVLGTSAAVNVEAARQFASVLDTFDLVVVDESHNLRKRGNNIKTKVLSTLFRFRLPKLDKKRKKHGEEHIEGVDRPRLLMLTATPAQRSEKDIYQQFAYRDAEAVEYKDCAEQTAEDRARYLQEHMIRRLRKLSGKTKYDYRYEKPRPTLEEVEPDPLEAYRESGQVEGKGEEREKAAERLTQELMLALVQKGLAGLRQQKGEGGTELKKSVKMGYLETFESYRDPSEAQKKLKDEDKTHDDTDKNTEAEDKDVLQHIVDRFPGVQQESEGKGEKTLPPHPKLSYLEEQFEEMLRAETPDKLLIFVRRRASVREIANRLCRVWDRVTLEELEKAYGEVELEDGNATGDGRFSEFVHHELAGKALEKFDYDLVDLSLQKDDDLVTYSTLMAPFKTGVKREDSDWSVGAAGFGFRKKFNKGETLGGFFCENRLRLFFALADVGISIFDKFPTEVLSGGPRSIEELAYGLTSLVDQFDEGENKDASRERRHFCDAALLEAMISGGALGEGDRELAKDLRDDRLGLRAESSDFMERFEAWKKFLKGKKDELLESLEGEEASEDEDIKWPKEVEHRRFWDVAREMVGEEAPEALRAMLRPDADSLDLTRRRGWRRMVSKLLRMSDAVIDLFYAFRVGKTADDNKKIDREKMAEFFWGKVFRDGGSEGDKPRRFRRLLHRISQSAELFDHLVKHLGVGEEEWATHQWDKFNDQEPVVGVMGGTGAREAVIAQFNAPFCPDVVVSTSVLREGVDLHLSCRRVWHYGLPASPGILEQQTGRVDRYFARVHRGLEDERAGCEDWEAWKPNQGKNGQEMVDRESTLDVGYPSVPRSVDEMQVQSLLVKKRLVEPLLDEGTSVAGLSDELNLDERQEMSPEEVVDPQKVAEARRERVGGGQEEAQGESVPFPGEDYGPSDDHVCRETLPAPHEAFDAVLETLNRFLWALKQSEEFEEPILLAEPYRAEDSQDGQALDDVREAFQEKVATLAREERPLAIVNKSLEGEERGGRHQPTLLTLRFVPHVSMHMLEFSTPLTGEDGEDVKESKSDGSDGKENNEGKADSKTADLREELLELESEHKAGRGFSGSGIVSGTTRGGLSSWSTYLVRSIPLVGPVDVADERVDEMTEKLRHFMELADKVEKQKLGRADIKFPEVKQDFETKGT